MYATAPSVSGRPFIRRRRTRRINVGSVPIGGGTPISVQTMTKTDTRDVRRTVEQILALEKAGCDIIRVAIPDEAAARTLAEIRASINIPLIADIHFDHKLALIALDAGADGLRINPGNIGSRAQIKAVVRAAESCRAPIRIGVNAGSLEKNLLRRFGGATAEALVESAMQHARLIEDCGYGAIKISVKASDVIRTISAYQMLSKTTDYPLHLGLTEAGTLFSGTVHSSVALGTLLAGGIGDTIRVSLTEQPEKEVRAGREILAALGLKKSGPRVISCPTCGRVQIDIISLAHEVESELAKLSLEFPGASWPVIAVMGCMVNGPGEAREADIALAGGKGKAGLFLKGRPIATVKEKDAVPALIKQVRAWLTQKHDPKPGCSSAPKPMTT